MVLQDGYKWHMLNAKVLFVFVFPCRVVKMYLCFYLKFIFLCFKLFGYIDVKIIF